MDKKTPRRSPLFAGDDAMVNGIGEKRELRSTVIGKPSSTSARAQSQVVHLAFWRVD